jgi:hypothetical protein
MQKGKLAATDKRRNAISNFAAARYVTSVARFETREEQKMFDALYVALPVEHRKHSDISIEDSQRVLRLMMAIYEAMHDHPNWYARAVEEAVNGTGIGHETVREIYAHYMATREFYQTSRMKAAKLKGSAEEDAEARDFLEFEITRLAAEGNMQTLRTLKN